MKQTSPEIDILAGIKFYSTQFEGIGGTIKKNYNDFHVQEIIDHNFLRQLTPYPTPTNTFPIYEIEKRGIDSNHAIIELKKKLGINLKIIGIKDAKATTIQYASSNSSINSDYSRSINPKKTKKPEKMRHTDSSVHLLYNDRNRYSTNNKNIKLSCKGFSKKPIEKDVLIGNTFKIRISDIKQNKIDKLFRFTSEMDDIGNYYGLQRFGSERLVTHKVGKAILRREFSEAIDILLTHTTKFDSRFSIEIRKKLEDIKNYPNIIKQIPKGMDIEKNIAHAILRGKHPISTVRTIPIGIRRLFIQAFQAFLFNKTLSRALLEDYPLRIPEKNDLCFEFNSENLKFGKICKYESNDNSEKNKTKRIPIIRLAGYSFQPGKGRFDTILKEIMEEERVTARDFFIKELQELSEPGGFRQAAYISKNFEYNTYNDSLLVRFSIPKGSYATILLREIMKPDNPITSGF